MLAICRKKTGGLRGVIRPDNSGSLSSKGVRQRAKEWKLAAFSCRQIGVPEFRIAACVSLQPANF
jgi:hypothetical protein